MKVEKKTFGLFWNKEVFQYILDNENGLKIAVITYGGILTNIWVKDKNKQYKDVVLGFDTLSEYLAGHPFFGATAGRFANRINKGKFSIDGKDYQLNAQAMGHHLHGGIRGFDKFVWDSEIKQNEDSIELILKHFSWDGDEKYPGNMHVSATYKLHKDNTFTLDFEATTDKKTIINLTNHSYFNLNGHNGNDIRNHTIAIDSEGIVEVTDELIPTGKIINLEGSVLDLRKTLNMGELFKNVKESIVDFCYVLKNKKLATNATTCVKVSSPESGISLEIATNNVGVQFYNGHKLKDQNKTGKGQYLYPKFGGFCIEPQCFPDAPNHVNFPTAYLNVGEVYKHTIVYKFNH